jgi:hypothetical protein
MAALFLSVFFPPPGLNIYYILQNGDNMLIRRQDKTIIHYVALLGAALSVFIASSLPGKLREKADSGTSQRNDSILQVGAINKLKQASDLSVQMDVIESVAKQLTAVEVKERSPQGPISLLASLSGWQVAVLAIGAGAAGYGVFWITMWSGVASLYILIRSVYSLIGLVHPTCAAAKKSTYIVDGRTMFQRDPDRILPLIIKVIVLLTLSLALLGVIVWQLTSVDL